MRRANVKGIVNPSTYEERKNSIQNKGDLRLQNTSRKQNYIKIQKDKFQPWKEAYFLEGSVNLKIPHSFPKRNSFDSGFREVSKLLVLLWKCRVPLGIAVPKPAFSVGITC